jgi:hypothetical protein
MESVPGMLVGSPDGGNKWNGPEYSSAGSYGEFLSWWPFPLPFFALRLPGYSMLYDISLLRPCCVFIWCPASA